MTENDDNENIFLISNISESTKKKKKPINTKKAKKKEKKKIKKLEKRKKELNEQLGIFLDEKDFVGGALMAEMMKKAERICVHDKKLMLYDNEKGCFSVCDKDEFSVKLNSILEDDVRMKIKSTEYLEAYKQIMMNDSLKYDDDFFENKPFVNCLNGVVDVLAGELLPHKAKYHFKHVINANYTPGAKCPTYLNYLYHLFDGDEELLQLVQVAQGYICSHYNNAKTAFLLYGESHTGKSVFHNVIEKIIGKEFVSHADLSYLCRQEYAASLSGKLLNIAPDLKNVPLRDVGFFKSLVSHDDTISTRALYNNPGDVRGEAKMIFTSNHLIEFDRTVDENDVTAVFNRLIYLPVQCKPINEKIENKHLSEEIFKERDAIFTWGIEGLKKYAQDGEKFPKSKLSEQIKRENMAKYCPEKVFFDKHIEEAKGQYESVTAIKEAFTNFCTKNKITRKSGITHYIEKKLHTQKIKKRIDNYGYSKSDGTPIYVYPNIRLKNNYR